MDIHTAISLGIEREFITDEVLKVISFYSGSAFEKPPITMHTKIVKDLGLEHDAVDIVFTLEERTRIKVPSSEWRTAITVQDVIDVLLKYAYQQNSS